MNTLVQLRIDEDSKIKASLICNKLGIDLQTYIRICISKLISNNGIPFDMVLNDNESKGMKALLEMGKISKENNNYQMSLDQINEEIKAVRSK